MKGFLEKIMQKVASDADIDAIIDGMYEEEDGDCPGIATDQDIDDIIAGTFKEGR